MPDKKKQRYESLCNEWNECRCSIARFDKIIVDIRKYGFTLITGLLSADAFLFVKVSELSPLGKAGVSIVMMVLIYALFIVDRYHEIFLRGAVSRAKAIEAELKLGLTTAIGKLSENAKTDTWGAKLYRLFIIVSAVPPLVTTVRLDPADIIAKLGFIIFLILVTSFFWLLTLRYDRLTRGKLSKRL